MPPAPGVPGVEIELKLLVDPVDLRALETAPVIEESARGRGTRRRLHDTYYDTADRRLRRAGLVLRVRQSGRRCVQTVKSARGQDPLRRGEWEAALPDGEPDFGLALPLLPGKLHARLESTPPGPVFHTDIRRLVRSVTVGDSRIEVAFDTGTIEAGEARLPVSEIELELKAGSPGAIYELGLKLLEHGLVRPSIRSKSDRGFDLADGMAPAAPKPKRLNLPEGVALDDGLLAILRAVLHHLLAALPAAEAGRPDGVHQTRVALRRLRSLFDIMHPVADGPAMAALRGEAGRIAGALGDVRDADVFIAETLAAIETALPYLDGLAQLRPAAEARRAEGYAGVRSVLADRRTSRFLLELGAWIEARGWRGSATPEALGVLSGPAAGFAAETLAALHARVLKRGRRFKTMDAAARHRLRIAVKKLRYAVEFFAPVLDDARAARRHLAALADLQDRLGRHNDMATTARLIAELGVGGTIGHAAGAVVGWQARGLSVTEPQLRDAWRDFVRLRPAWESPPSSA